MQNRINKNVYNVVIVGLMAAMVFVGTMLHIDIPTSPTDKTMISFGNSMCVLAGLLFGPLRGGLAAGIGSMIYDLMDPIFLPGFWWTFIAKFVMGFVAGVVYKHIRGHRTLATAVAAVCGAFSYVVLYLGKSFVTDRFIKGYALETVLVTVGTKALTSTFNAVVAVVISFVLASLIRPALRRAKLLDMGE